MKWAVSCSILGCSWATIKLIPPLTTPFSMARMSEEEVSTKLQSIGSHGYYGDHLKWCLYTIMQKQSK